MNPHDICQKASMHAFFSLTNLAKSVDHLWTTGIQKSAINDDSSQ